MKKTMYAAAAAFALLATSCAMVGTPVGIGSLYTGVTSGEAVTSNTLGKKVGHSQAINVLGIVATGDASIQEAAKQAGIKKISHVDSKKTSILGIYSSYQTLVYGD
jgi:Zn-dependent alcohol dehydrogenase